MRTVVRSIAALGLLATPFVGARADLILVSPNIVTLGGTGLGSVNTILTIQNSPTETGCVAFNGSGDQLGATQSGGACSGSSGDVKTGNSQTQTRTLAEAGITQGSNFTVFFNAAEPSGDDVTLTALTASFYNNAGTLLHTATYTGIPHNFPVTATGTGNTGYQFVLDANEASVLQGFITSLGASNIHVGMSLAASNTSGGPETVFIYNSNTISPTPEPSTIALVTTGLFGVVGAARRRRRA